MVQETISFNDILQRAIQVAISEEANRQIEEAKKRLNERLPEIIVSVTLGITKMIEMDDLQDRVVFTIKKNP